MIFNFKAKNFEGQEVEGRREARDRFTLARELRGEGFVLVDFKEEGKNKKFNIFSISFTGVPLAEKIIFTRNLAVMLGAGLAVSRSIKALVRQVKNKRFKEVLAEVNEGVIEGRSLSESMNQHRKIFSPLYISMVKAGEKSGKLQESLKLLASQMESTLSLRKKIKGAMIYPIIVVVAMIGVGIVMLIYVVPSLVSTFESLSVELPATTKFIVWLSSSIIANSFIILGILAILTIFVLLLMRNSAIRRMRDKLWLRLPLISPLIIKINSARTARTLSSLIESGVEILESLNITSEVVQNVHYKKVLIKAKEEVQKGSSIASSFEKATNVFPPLFSEMVAVGEETGQLSKMLLELAVFYEEEVSQATKNIATVIEPVLMIVIGFMVGFFAISMIKPMYSLMEGL